MGGLSLRPRALHVATLGIDRVHIMGTPPPTEFHIYIYAKSLAIIRLLLFVIEVYINSEVFEGAFACA